MAVYIGVLVITAACEEAAPAGPDAAGGAGDADAADDTETPWSHGVVLPSSPQDVGDPVRGRQILLNGSYMSCGIPWSLWSDPTFGPMMARSFGVTQDPPLTEGREGHNVDLPFSLNAFVAADGTEVVNRNCLGCHAGRFDGELVIGLGNATADFTGSYASDGGTLPSSVLDRLPLTDAERAHLERVLRAFAVVGPSMAMRTVGQNPAEQMTYVLLGHHDPETLAWLDTPSYTAAPPRDASGALVEDPVLTSDPPPWWRAHKKNALFYNGMSRGQHRGTMALATSMCVEDLAEAARVDRLFLDMHAYVLSLRPPTYRRQIDRALAADGKAIFETTCSGCHGTYADDPSDDAHDWYPNLILPLDVIGTDPAVAQTPLDNAAGGALYNASFYGQIAPSLPDDPVVGYVAPPLDGIWATAPFLHNGSVPTIELVLDSTRRPKVWRRVDLDDTHFDEEALGWPYEALDKPSADAPEPERKYLYDTSYYSQSNAGHTFGDALSPAERRAVIEYLKTL